MDAPEVRRAVEAGKAAATALGLHATGAAVISNSDRIVVRLMPCGVLARIGPAQHHAGFEFEAAVAHSLAGNGGPVAPLDARAGNRVYQRDGFVISLWTYCEPAGAPVPPAEYAGALERLHAALRRADLAAPHLTERVAGAQREIDDTERTPELPGPDRELLSGTLSRLSSLINHRSAGRQQLLHGEPHPGNLLSTREGLLFIDLETCCRGPVEFDLAHAPEGAAGHYPGADHDLTGQCRVLMWALIATWRWCDSDQFPNRQYWRTEALSRVRAALDRHGAGGA